MNLALPGGSGATEGQRISGIPVELSRAYRVAVDGKQVAEFPLWVATICALPDTFREGGRTLRDLFGEADLDLADQEAFVALVRNYLGDHPDLAESWQSYSYDKRSSPSPYLDGKEVGFFSGDRNNVRHHEDPLDACADFIYREAAWVLERRVVG